MKRPIATATLLILSSFASLSQKPVPAPIPELLKPQFAVLNNAYPNVDAKKFPKAPADSIWLFRSFSVASGTVEVAFQGAEVVYMVFRRGTGGSAWKIQEVQALHRTYSKTLLNEVSVGRYNHSLATQINAAIISRRDFDAKSLASGM